MQIDPDLVPLLAAWERPRLDSDPGVVLAYWADGRIAYFNDCYEAQGRAVSPQWTQRWGLGAVIWDAMLTPIRERLELASGEVLRGGGHWQTTYRCPIPSAQRWMTLRMYPLGDQALLTCHGLLRSIALTGPEPGLPLDAAYYNESQLLVQCASCRHVRRVDAEGEQWVFVPQLLVKGRTDMTHTLCHACFPLWCG